MLECREVRTKDGRRKESTGLVQTCLYPRPNQWSVEGRTVLWMTSHILINECLGDPGERPPVEELLSRKLKQLGHRNPGSSPKSCIIYKPITGGLPS